MIADLSACHLPRICCSIGVVKALTRAQLESRKEKAVRFVRDVLHDADRAEEIAEEPLEHYAETAQDPDHKSIEKEKRNGNEATA